MDKKLLLAMQYCCNLVGLTMPWSDIGSIMGEGISGGAVIQHLAKLRIRMIEQNLSVPPPLKRGGGTRLSTSASSGTKAKTSTAKSNGTSKVKKSGPKKANKGSKKATPGSNDSEEDEDAWVNDDDSDAEYAEPLAKRTKPNAKDIVRSRKTKTEDSEEEVVTPSRPSKRKHQSTMSSPAQNHGEDEIKTEYVAAGANFLSLEDDDAGHPKNGKKTAYTMPSKIVTLPMNPRKIGMVGGLKEDAGYMSDEDGNEMAGDGVETFADGSHALSNEGTNGGWSYEGVEYQAPSSVNNVGVYDHAYNTNNMNFNEGFADTSINDYQNSIGLATNGNTFENNELVKNEAVGQFGAFGGTGGHFGILTNFNSQSAGTFPEINRGFGEDFNDPVVNAASFGNGGMTNGNNMEEHHNVHGDALSYQTGNGYGASSNTFGNNFDRPLRFDKHNHTQTVPYHIQTSWPNIDNSAGPSSKTSVNQTPADTSAGVDMGAGYFGSGQLDYGFDDAAVDYSANDGSDMLFGAGDFDGNLVGGSFFGSDTYGN